MSDDTTHHINESADKIVLKAEAKRGSGTRDQDKVKIKCKGNDPDETAAQLAATLDALEEHGVTDSLRQTRAGGGE